MSVDDAMLALDRTVTRAVYAAVGIPNSLPVSDAILGDPRQALDGIAASVHVAVTFLDPERTT